jgi:hypothetical protein
MEWRRRHHVKRETHGGGGIIGGEWGDRAVHIQKERRAGPIEVIIVPIVIASITIIFRVRQRRQRRHRTVIIGRTKARGSRRRREWIKRHHVKCETHGGGGILGGERGDSVRAAYIQKERRSVGGTKVVGAARARAGPIEVIIVLIFIEVSESREITILRLIASITVIFRVRDRRQRRHRTVSIGRRPESDELKRGLECNPVAEATAEIG